VKETELIHTLNHVKYDVVGLSEVRRKGCSIEEHKNYILCYNGITQGENGVGFLINIKHKSNIESFRGLSERVALLDMKIENFTISIVQAYAPTSTASDDELESFYCTLNEAIQLCGKNMIIMGDFNAKIGQPGIDEYTVMGKFGHGNRNTRGDRLIQFAFEHRMSIMNTFFKKRPNQKWTWRSPDGTTKNEIDFILTNFPRQFTDVHVLNKVAFPSDHRLVRAEIHIKKSNKSRKTYSRHSTCCFKSENDISSYKKILETNKDDLLLNNETSVQIFYDNLEQYIKNCLKSCNSHENGKHEKSILSENTKDLIKKRQELQNFKPKSSEIKRELSRLYKDTSKSIRSDYQRHRNTTIEKHIKCRGSLKRAYKELSTYKAWIPSLKSGSESNTTRTDIINIATGFYKNLYDDKNISNNVSDINIQTDTMTLDDNVEEWTEAELIQLIKGLKNEKSAGPDGIPNEAIKHGAGLLAHPIAHLFNLIKKAGTVPHQWTESNIILLYKKGNPNDISNYRPISLLPALYKLFSTSLCNRISPQLDKNQPIEQAGFRKGFSTNDHIQTAEQVIEKYREFNRSLYLAFIDYKKAFDTISHNTIWKALHENNIHQTYTNVLKNIYTRSISRVKLERAGPAIKIKRGVKQGDPISPKLFIAVLELVFKQLNWTREGILVNGKHLSHLRFADDIILFAESSFQLELMMNSLNKESLEVGLEMNFDKTKVMTNHIELPIKVCETTIEYVGSYIYLGKKISFDPNSAPDEIKRRINLSWNKYWALKEVFKSDMPLPIKKRVMDSCILPCLTYSSQTWPLTKRTKQQIRSCQSAMERSVLKIKRLDKVRNTTIKEKTKFLDFLAQALKLKWRWAGHLARLENSRWAKEVTVWPGPAGKRTRGRPRTRWADDLRAVAGAKWISIAADRELWKSLEEAFTL
jgi:hypothetical protein